MQVDRSSSDVIEDCAMSHSTDDFTLWKDPSTWFGWVTVAALATLGLVHAGVLR